MAETARKGGGNEGGKSSRKLRRYAPPDLEIKKKLGGGRLKHLVIQDEDSGEVLHYSLVYINPMIFAGDNGRVLGYDNSHGYSQKHYFGVVTAEPFITLEALRARFENEWRAIAMKFVNGEAI